MKDSFKIGNEIYKDLLEKTKEAFDKSHIKRYAEERGKKWYYNVCATKISQNSLLLIGFNWGAGQLSEFHIPPNMPEESFLDLADKKGKDDSLGSFSRIKGFLEKYLPNEDLTKANQSNYCFFRSANQDQISSEDIELSKPLFLNFLNRVEPNRILAFSKKLALYLDNRKMIKDMKSKRINFRVGSQDRSYLVVKGRIDINEHSIDIFCLPHPNYPMTTEARHKCWRFCFKESSEREFEF